MAFLGFIRPNFKDITMQNQYITAHIGLAKYGWRFAEAQKWFDRKMLEKMQPVLPRKTGEFREKINAANATRIGTGIIVTSVPPQGRKLYQGFNPRTGIKYNWTNPLTQPRWGTWVYQTYKPELLKGVRQIIIKGKTNG